MEPITEPTAGSPTPAPMADAPAPAANGDDEVALSRLPSEPATDADRASASSVDLTLSPPPPTASVAPPAISADALSPLEERIRRIEDALARLQVSPPAETRIATPVSHSPPTPAATAALLDMGKRLLGAAAEAVTPNATPASTHRAGALWFLWDTWAEARAIVRMFVDPRYNLPWSARVLPIVLLGAIITSYYWVPGTSIPLLGGWINKAVDLVLAFLLFKWLGHEARRYRQTSPDLPPNLRL